MQKLKDNQEILNSVMDKQNIRIKSVSKNGNKQFLQYYIDNNKLSELLPIQIILNSIFDRQTSSICISGVFSQGNSDLSNYSGNVSISDSNGENIIVSYDGNITVGNNNSSLTINATDVLYNGNGINTPNGFVTLNSNGKIDNDLIDLQFDPKKLTLVQDAFSLPSEQVQITIKDNNGVYRAITLQQLSQLFAPQLQIVY